MYCISHLLLLLLNLLQRMNTPTQSFGASFGQLPSFFPLQLSTSPLGGACVSSDLTIPTARPTWTCGLQVTGAFDCSATGGGKRLPVGVTISYDTATTGGSTSSTAVGGGSAVATSTSTGGAGLSWMAHMTLHHVLPQGAARAALGRMEPAAALRAVAAVGGVLTVQPVLRS